MKYIFGLQTDEALITAHINIIKLFKFEIDVLISFSKANELLGTNIKLNKQFYLTVIGRTQYLFNIVFKRLI